MKPLLFSLLVFLFCISFVNAATIHGSVYDFSLNNVKNIVIDVNSIPSQSFVSRDGNYKFTLPYGDFVISARLLPNRIIAEENVTIKQDGDFIIDLFVSPDIPESELVSNIDYDYTSELNSANESRNWNIIYYILLALVIVGCITFYIKKKKGYVNNSSNSEESVDELPEKVIEIIKKDGGRITQKSLRKHFPFSESKVSLVISELESKGVLEKIKKGRGNILILKK